MCRSNLITLCPAVPIVNDLLSASLYDTVSDIVEKLVQLGSSFQSGFRVLKMVLYEHSLRHICISYPALAPLCQLSMICYLAVFINFTAALLGSMEAVVDGLTS